MTFRAAVCAIAIALLSTPAFAQARVRVTRNQTSVWQAGFLSVIVVVPAGTELEVVGRQGMWYEVVVPSTGPGRATGFVAVSAVEAIGGAPLPRDASPARGQPRPTPGVGRTSPAAAPRNPDADAWHGRGRVGINFVDQVSSPSYTAVATAPVYFETATFSTAYAAAKGPAIDASVTARGNAHFGVEIAASFFTKKTDGVLTGSIPNPLVFGAFRPISGSASGLERREIAAHLDLVYLVGLGKADVALLAGPSIFNVRQDLVTGASYTDLYPYDTATFNAATTTTASNTGVGFNAGADVTLRLTRTIGVGALVRYSRATISLSPSDGQSLDVRAGGLQAGGGIRLLF